LVVNGVRLGNPLAQVELALSTGMDLTPRRLYLTHGQLRFDHILIGPPDEFVLLEPRGWRELRDVSYEVGKLVQCLLSRIVWIERGRVTIRKWRSYADVLEIDGFAVDASDHRQSVADEVWDRTLEGLGGFAEWKSDSGSQRRAQIAAATHSLAGIPFFWRPDQPSIGLGYLAAGAIAAHGCNEPRPSREAE
jgi:hypothetical protein